MISEYWIWVATAAVVLAAGAFLWRRAWLRGRGPMLEQALRVVAIDHLRDVLLPDGMGGQIQVEHLLLTGNGIVVIDVKAFEGTIFASDRMEEWTVIGRRGRFTFPNPQGTLYDRVAALRQLVRDVPVAGLVLFSLSEARQTRPRAPARGVRAALGPREGRDRARDRGRAPGHSLTPTH